MKTRGKSQDVVNNSKYKGSSDIDKELNIIKLIWFWDYLTVDILDLLNIKII